MLRIYKRYRGRIAASNLWYIDKILDAQTIYVFMSCQKILQKIYCDAKALVVKPEVASDGNFVFRCYGAKYWNWIESSK